MKSRKRPSRLPEDWETVQNTHEGIVSQEEFDTVQRLMTSRRKTGESGYDNIFAGIIKCDDCGYHLSAASANRRKRPELIDCIVYWCGNYTRYGNISCTSHTIEARDLHNAVLADINFYASMAMHDPKAVATIQQKLNAMDTGEAKAQEHERRKLAKRLNELDKLFSALYEDKVMERISERNYDLMRSKYEKEQLETDNRLKEIDTDLTAKGISDKGVADFFTLISRYNGITELTAATINALIDKITVSERKKNENGMTEQRITIFYKFVGSLHEFYIPVPSRTCYMEERACARCGKTYIPGSNAARYCPVCREVATREHAVKSNEVRKTKRQVRRQAVSLSRIV